MNFNTPGAVLTLLVLLATTSAFAQDKDTAQAREQAELKAAYEEALESAGREQREAREAIERARADLDRNAQEQERHRAKQEAEQAAMRAELSRAHEELRNVSREVARVHRELNRRSAVFAPLSSLINLGDKAVIGIVLGNTTKDGMQILGISPDGPSDRAGLQQGDVIISIKGQALVDEDSDDARDVLHEVMESVAVGDEITITVDRDGDVSEFTVIADKREPFSWQSIVRLPSAPSVPGAPVIIERIEIPEIDEEAILVQIERVREGMERARALVNTTHDIRIGDAPESWEYEFKTFSDFGDGALREANIWFGLPVTRGLKLAEIDAGLGEYFKTDRGVLVLKAREGNDLQLESGDVILQVGDREVSKPSDVMRALREWESGASIEIEIKRQRKDRTLEVVLPESRMGFGFAPEADNVHIRIHTTND